MANKQVLHFGSPARLSLRHGQLVISREDRQDQTRPLEDIASLVVDHPEARLTTPLVQKAAEMGVCIVWCDARHLPCAYTLPLVGHTLQNLRHRQQWAASVPLNKQIWARLVRQKLLNPARVLEHIGHEALYLHRMARETRSGDPENREGQGARWYWPRIFGHEAAALAEADPDAFEAPYEPEPGSPPFTRDRYDPFPNHWLNYGYAVVRAAMARSLVGAGLCVSLGVHHHNPYNAFCLADDCMEPWRAWVDYAAWQLVRATPKRDLDPVIKAALLSVLLSDAKWDHAARRLGVSTSPLMVSMDSFAASLGAVFAAEKQVRELKIPQFPDVLLTQA